MNKFTVVSLAKNKNGTGLANVISHFYKNKLKENIITFPLVDWKIKTEGEVVAGWKEISKNWKRSTFYYVIDKNGKEIIWKTQGSFLPLITALLLKMWMKDTLTDEKPTKPKDFMEVKVIWDEMGIDFTDVDEKDIPKRKINYKLWIIEIFNKLFKNGNEIYFPLDEKYKKATMDTKKMVHPGIKKVHLYKKLMGNVMIDHPFQRLTNFAISSSSFNVNADWIQPVIIEDMNWKLFETIQIRAKTLIEEWKLRVSSLLWKLTKETFDELVDLKLISETKYDSSKIYNINLDWDWINKEEGLPLVSPEIKSIPQEEIVTLVSEISYLKLKQKVYNKKEKELYEKLDLILNYERKQEDNHLLELWIRNWIFNPSFEKITDTSKLPTLKMVRKIEIEEILTAAEKRVISSKYLERLDAKLNKVNELDFVMKMDYDKELLKIVREDIAIIKELLEEKRFKLNLIKSALFMNWLEMADSLNWDWETEEKPSKAANSFDWKNYLRNFSNKAKTKTIRVKIAKLNKAE